MKKESFDDLKENIEERVSCLILSALILELIILVILVVFEYNKEDAIDFFYLYSVIFLILAAIYFVWSSVVKENAYELPSFILISGLLNAHAVIQVLNDGKMTFLHWLALFTFIISQIIYFICSPFAYQKYSWRMMNEIKSSNPRLLTGFKVLKHFESISKLDFLLFCLIACIYLFAILIDWNSFHILGLVLGFGSMAFIGLVSWMGVISALTENRVLFSVFFGLRFCVQGLLGFFLFQVIYGSEPLAQRLIFYEMIVIASIDSALYVYQFFIACWAWAYFGLGLKNFNFKSKEKMRTPMVQHG